MIDHRMLELAVAAACTLAVAAVLIACAAVWWALRQVKRVDDVEDRADAFEGWSEELADWLVAALTDDGAPLTNDVDPGEEPDTIIAHPSSTRRMKTAALDAARYGRHSAAAAEATGDGGAPPA